MQHLKTLLLFSLVLLTMACTIAPIGFAGPKQPGASTSAAPASTLPLAMPSQGSDVPAPIDLHVGRGMRGPWFELYFTDPANPAGLQFTGGLDERLVQAIDAAHLSIHLAIYSLSLNNVRLALIRAHRRGVDVRLVTESDNLDGDDLQRLIDAGIPVLGDRREGIMHDKFMVIDGMEVWTGSMNYTSTGVYADNNCLIRIFSRPLGQAYEAEFYEMFVEDHFGPQNGNSLPAPTLQIDGTPIEVRFSPDDHPEGDLVNLLDTAQNSIEFLAFSFTSNPLAAAVLRAQAAGIKVQGVMDEEQASSNIGGELGTFRSAGLDVHLDGNPGQMHEKVLIIDRQIVVFGSYNFSRSANATNDENLLILHNDLIAGSFAEEFVRIYAASAP